MEVSTTLTSGIDWIVSDELVDYLDAQTWMEARAGLIARGEARECVWLLEHPPLYTAGTSAKAYELLAPRFPVFKTGRGGRYTYHGPGQRVGYLMLDLNTHGRDVRQFVHALEGCVIGALGRLGLAAHRADGRIGIWVEDPDLGEAKIGAIGIRVRRWITTHGFSVNLDPDLRHFDGIVPCGIPDFGVTSIAKLGHDCGFAVFDAAFQAEFVEYFGNQVRHNSLEQ